MSSITYNEAVEARARAAYSTPSVATVRFANGDIVELFLKVHKKGNRGQHMFEKEVDFYERIQPRMRRFQEKQGLQDSDIRLDQYIPQYFGSALVNGDVVMVLENIYSKGFKSIGQQDLHTFEQVTGVLKALGTFHAVSYSMKVIDGVVLKSDIPNLCNCNNCVIDIQLAKSNIQYLQVLQALVSSKSNPIVSSNLKHFCSATVLRELIELSPHLLKILQKLRTHDIEPQALLCHGDFHTGNQMFQGYDHVKVVDFQLLCYCPGTIEVFHFLGKATNSTARLENLDHYLEAYSNSFLRTAKSLGVQDHHLERFKLSSLKSEIRGRGAYLYAYQLGASVIKRLIENKKVFGMREDDEIIAALRGCGKLTWQALQEAMNMINEFEGYGTFDIMKDIVGGLKGKAKR